MIALKILAILWLAPTIFFVVCVLIPYTLCLIEDARWQRMHLGMPLSRRIVR